MKADKATNEIESFISLGSIRLKPCVPESIRWKMRKVMAMRTLSKKRVMKSVKTKFTFIAKVRIVKLAVKEPIYIMKRA